MIAAPQKNDLQNIRHKKRGQRPLSCDCCGFQTLSRLPPSFSLSTDGNLTIVVILVSVCPVHQVAAEVGDIEPDGRTGPEGGHRGELLCKGELVSVYMVVARICPAVPSGVLLGGVAGLEYGAGEVRPLV